MLAGRTAGSWAKLLAFPRKRSTEKLKKLTYCLWIIGHGGVGASRCGWKIAFAPAVLWTIRTQTAAGNGGGLPLVIVIVIVIVIASPSCASVYLRQGARRSRRSRRPKTRPHESHSGRDLHCAPRQILG